jgi:hypothetical protein
MEAFTTASQTIALSPGPIQNNLYLVNYALHHISFKLGQDVVHEKDCTRWGHEGLIQAMKQQAATTVWDSGFISQAIYDIRKNIVVELYQATKQPLKITRTERLVTITYVADDMYLKSCGQDIYDPARSSSQACFLNLSPKYYEVINLLLAQHPLERSRLNKIMDTLLTEIPDSVDKLAMALCYKGMEPESVAKMLRLTLEELEAIYNRSFWNKLEEKIIALFKSDTT